MKVVREIIWYLNDQRLLMPEGQKYLRSRGFIDFEEEAALLRCHRDGPVPEHEPEDDARMTLRRP